MKLLTVVLAALALGAPATADDLSSSFVFNYRVAGTPALVAVTPLSTVLFPDTAIGKSSTISFLIQTSPDSKNVYTIMNAAATGAGFTLAQQSGTVPAMASGFGTITVNFTPLAGEASTGSLQFNLAAANGLTFNFNFTLFGRITAPKIVTSYSLAATNNQVTVQAGDTIQFPNTAVNGTSQATFFVANTGTGTAIVDSVSLPSAAYKLGNLNLLPATVAGGSDFHFTITFSPIAAKDYTGALTVSVGGKPSTYLLDGQGTSAAFSYQLVTGSTTQPLAAGATIALPDTPADGTTKNSVTVQVTNTGNLDGVLANINVSGSDFQLANVPALPKTLGAANSTTGLSSSAFFDIVFQPAKPGNSTGRLQVGNDVFSLTGTGLGFSISVSADVGTGPIQVQNKGTIAIPNTAVGAKRSVFISVANTGNQPATVSSFSAAGAVFTTPNLPGLPIALAPGQTQRFELRFAPTATGQVTANLAINDQVFTLVGSGDPPLALPAVTITGIAAQTDPLQQPAPALQLAAPYSADLKGVLTLAFLSDSSVDDPSIEFANGSRTVNFTIPSGTTQAVFDQLGRAAPFQTGTISGTVLLSARFTVGTVDITPDSAPSKSTAIPPGPPQLSSIRLGNQTGTTLDLLISGYSTARSVTQLALAFTGVTGANLQTTSRTVDVGSAFTNWYADPASRPFGSQFTLTLTLTLTGDPNALQTIAVTASNARGTSAAKSVALR